MNAFRPPHGPECPHCHPAPSWGGLLATVGTVLAAVVFLVAAVLIGTNVALWAQVHP